MKLLHFSLLFTFITGFTTSENDLDPSQIPYTDSDRDLASPSQDSSLSMTRLPDIFWFRSKQALRTASVLQGGGYSGTGDKSRLQVVPQESTHNGQEKAGTVISDLTHTTMLSLSELSVTEKEQVSSLFSAETQWAGLTVSTLSTTTHSGSNVAETMLPENIPLATKIYWDARNDMDTPSVHSSAPHARESRTSHGADITVMSSAPHLSTLTNKALVTEIQTSESHGFNEITDWAVMSSSYLANSHPHPYQSKQNVPDFSVTDQSTFQTDSTSILEDSESNSVRYISDTTVQSWSGFTDTSKIEVSRTNRLPRSAHVIEKIPNRTHTPLQKDSPITTTDTPRASASHRQVDMSTVSDSHFSALENITATNRKRSAYYSYTPYYTKSTHTYPTPPDLATTPTAPTIPSEQATVSDQTTNQHRGDTDDMSTQTLPTQSDSHSVSGQRRDLISTPASSSSSLLVNSQTLQFLSVITANQNDSFTTVKSSTHVSLYESSQTRSSADTEGQAQNGNGDVKGTTTGTSGKAQINNPSPSTEYGPMTVTHHMSSTPPTSLNPGVAPESRLTSSSTPTLNSVTTNTPLENLHTTDFITTTQWPETRIPNQLTTSRSTTIIQRPNTITVATTTQHTRTKTLSHRGTHTPLTAITQMSSLHTTKSGKDWSHQGQVFIMPDQSAILTVETFQVLLQVILEENSAPQTGLVEVEPFLQKVAGYQSQHVTWHSGPVLQSLVMFRTAEAVSWLGRAESLLQEAGLKPLPPRGVFVSGIRVKNITVGGLHSDVCSWLFSCPSDFYCISSEGNITCRSVCYSEYCMNHGICVHRSGERPLCQCPVGENFWFMGQRCDLHMTRHSLAGMCFGVLVAIAAFMGLLAYLAVQRFKSMLIQAKAEQTQSSYRRFNHFDELSARFWRRSWPGSQDSLDNTAFSRSDELLHMRARDHACCYHDDTLSIASTYPDSVPRLNTVYPHSSQYHWDMSTCSLADGVIDSGKASDLSVCSWPIEPIQWTPFPLLQQLKNTNTMKESRPHSYCEGMELVGLEKSRTA